jgi:hypothetical protein
MLSFQKPGGPRPTVVGQLVGWSARGLPTTQVLSLSTFAPSLKCQFRNYFERTTCKSRYLSTSACCMDEQVFVELQGSVWVGAISHCMMTMAYQWYSSTTGIAIPRGTTKVHVYHMVLEYRVRTKWYQWYYLCQYHMVLPWYSSTYTCTYICQWYTCTYVSWHHGTIYGYMVLEYTCTMVPWYVHVYQWYTRTYSGNTYT